MNYFTKKNLVILSIIVLLVVNVAAISTIVFLTYKESSLPDHRPPRETFRGMRHGLGFSDDQQIAIEEYRNNYRENTKHVFEKLHEKRVLMMDEFSRAEPDSSMLYKLAEETGILHQELKRLTIDHMLEIKAICSEEQFKKLEGMFRRQMMDDFPRRGHHPDMERKRGNRKNR